jgi:hypothetical protein
MKINEPENPERDQPTQNELEKLLEQKQDETEALKRLIHILEKAETRGGSSSPDKKA